MPVVVNHAATVELGPPEKLPISPSRRRPGPPRRRAGVAEWSIIFKKNVVKTVVKTVDSDAHPRRRGMIRSAPLMSAGDGFSSAPLADSSIHSPSPGKSGQKGGQSRDPHVDLNISEGWISGTPWGSNGVSLPVYPAPPRSGSPDSEEGGGGGGSRKRGGG